MSFEITRPYPRAILRPLQLARNPTPTLPDAKTNTEVSSLWTATAHSFFGTKDRAIPRSWPPSRFGEDPSALPDDDKYNVYGPATPTSQSGIYRMYKSQNKSQQAHEAVPVPRLAAKRYIPTSRTTDGAGPGVTLLLLPGMGLVKEVRTYYNVMIGSYDWADI